MVLTLSGCGKNNNDTEQKPIVAEPQIMKVGYFPNITHAQALAGMNMGTFQKALGDSVKLEAKIFNAGPAEIEALFAGEIDLGYIGPSPALNGYIKSQGQALQIISGSASGGASLIVSQELANDYSQNGVNALIGKKIASPQQGNTQDISLRHYLKDNGILEKTQIIPIANADQLTMFSQKELDGAWAPEPWASRLIEEAGGVRLIDERDLWPNNQFTTTNIIVRTEFLNQHPDLVKNWLRAQVEITNWLKNNPIEAQAVVNSEIEKLSSKKLADNVLSSAWEKLNFTVDPLTDSVKTFASWAFDQGYLGKTQPDLTNLYNLNLLNEVTGQKYQ